VFSCPFCNHLIYSDVEVVAEVLGAIHLAKEHFDRFPVIPDC